MMPRASDQLLTSRAYWWGLPPQPTARSHEWLAVRSELSSVPKQFQALRKELTGVAKELTAVRNEFTAVAKQFMVGQSDPTAVLAQCIGFSPEYRGVTP